MGKRLQLDRSGPSSLKSAADARLEGMAQIRVQSVYLLVGISSLLEIR